MDLLNTVASVAAPVAASVATSTVAASAVDPVAASASADDRVAVDADIAKDITAKLALNPGKSPYEVCKICIKARRSYY